MSFPQLRMLLITHKTPDILLEVDVCRPACYAHDVTVTSVRATLPLSGYFAPSRRPRLHFPLLRDIDVDVHLYVDTPSIHSVIPFLVI